MNRLIIILCCLLTAISCLAQSSIDKVFDALERSKDAKEVYYTERRTKKGRKLYHATRTIVFEAPSWHKSFEAAFEKERSNAYQATKQNQQLYYRFVSGKVYSQYSLTFDPQTNTSRAVMVWTDESIKDDDNSYNPDKADDAILLAWNGQDPAHLSIPYVDSDLDVDYSDPDYLTAEPAVFATYDMDYGEKVNVSSRQARAKAQEARKKAMKQREDALRKAQQRREEALRKAQEQRELAYKKAEKAREEAYKQREEAMHKAQELRETAYQKAEKAREKALKQREEALKQREEALRKAQEQREIAYQKAEKAREKAMKKREKALRKAQEARRKALEQLNSI